jgi:hypothetical protein
MNRKFKVIGLALAIACSFGAVSAATAQAAPQFTVGGAPVTGQPAIASTVKITSTDLTLEVPDIPLVISCTGASINGGKLTGTTTISATSLTFTGCTVTSNPKCQVKSVGGTFGSISTGGVTGKLVTVGTATDSLFSPEGTNFVELEIAKNELGTCPISGKYKVTGNAALQVTTGTSATYVTGTASKAIQQAYNATTGAVKLTVGAKEAWLVGVVDVALASDGNWGVDA